MQLIKQWSTDLIGLLFPNLCNACGVPLFHSENCICTKCLYDLPFTDYHLFNENRVAKQLWGRLQLNAAMAMLYFRKGAKVQNLVHNLKYNGKTDVGIFLGGLLGEKLKTSPFYQKIDLIIPVPLHPKKLRLRGYNQCSFIAKGIADNMMIDVNESTLIRGLETESQTKKSRYKRYENMKAVFKILNPKLIEAKHILLVDDVVTTGATLEACSNVLLEHGALKVSVATLAFAE